MTFTRHRVNLIRARKGCLTCGGAGASVPLEEATLYDYCDDCVLSELHTDEEFVLLADGDIEVRAA
jgi:hypothetical protein